MLKLVILSAGILAVSGASVAFALRDDPAGANPNSQSSPDLSQPTVKNESSLKVDLDMESSSNGTSGSAGSSTTLRVNGQNIEVPANGEVHEQINNDDGQSTDVRIRNTTRQSGASNSNTTNLRIITDSESSTSTSRRE